jgi:UDP-glucose 4-epimerase
MRILVTGAKGFVGSHLTEYLSQRCGHLVGIMDIVDGIDITNREQVFYFFEKFKPHIVYHLAAQINPKKSEENRELDWKVNVEGTLNIIDATIESPANVLVFTSSDAAVNSISNYGVTKKTAEEYILKYTRQGKIQGKIARFSSVYGTGRGIRGALNRFVNQAVTEQPITLYLSALDAKRDFIYVKDCVRALELIQRDGEIGEIYNVGTGIQYSINSAAYLVRDLYNGIAIDLQPLAIVERVEGGMIDTSGSKFDTTELAKLGFVAKTDLVHGIKKLFNWEYGLVDGVE